LLGKASDKWHVMLFVALFPNLALYFVNDGNRGSQRWIISIDAGDKLDAHYFFLVVLFGVLVHAPAPLLRAIYLVLQTVE